jgi:hypothetical protein
LNRTRTFIATIAAIGVIAVIGLRAHPAFAGDGRLEINQSCIAAGCFPGDSPGFPVETQDGKSYVLTSSLVVPTLDTRAIWLQDRAVLDLNGFEISGPATCTGAPPACSTGGQGDGVYAEDHSTVRNGTIRAMGRYGVACEVGVTVENMLIQANANTGIYMNYGPDGPEAHLIRGVRVIGNGGDGIMNSGGFGGIGTLISDCTIHGNAHYGLSVFQSQVTNCVVTRNGDEGIYGTNTAVGGSTFQYNNGGNDAAQTAGSLISIGTNACGNDTTCP